MTDVRKMLSALPALPLAGAAVVLGQVLYAAHRPDLPSFPNQDPSGSFGDPSRPMLTIAALGDSSLTAPGVEDLDNVWVRAIALGLSDRYRVELISVADGGAKARHVLAGQVPAALALEPDIAVVSVGANDALRATPITRYEREQHTIVAALLERAHAVVMLGVGDLGTIPRLPRLAAAFATWRSRTIDRAVTRVADSYQTATRIECWGEISDAFRYGGPEMFSGDQFHASDLGHQAFAGGAGIAFERALTFVPQAAGPA